MSYGFNEDKSKYNLDIESLAAGIITEIYDQIYPKGSLYMTFDDDFDPNNEFVGEWVEIDGKFIYASGGDSGRLGGASNITLKSNQCAVPSHSHDNNISITDSGHVHTQANKTIVGTDGSQTKIDGNQIKTFLCKSSYAESGTQAIYNSNRRVNNTTTKSPLTTASGKAKLTKSGGVQSTGSNIGTSSSPTTASAPVSIMPPYITAHVWKRVN